MVGFPHARQVPLTQRDNQESMSDTGSLQDRTLFASLGAQDGGPAQTWT